MTTVFILAANVLVWGIGYFWMKRKIANALSLKEVEDNLNELVSAFNRNADINLRCLEEREGSVARLLSSAGELSKRLEKYQQELKLVGVGNLGDLNNLSVGVGSRELHRLHGVQELNRANAANGESEVRGVRGVRGARGVHASKTAQNNSLVERNLVGEKTESQFSGSQFLEGQLSESQSSIRSYRDSNHVDPSKKSDMKKSDMKKLALNNSSKMEKSSTSRTGKMNKEKLTKENSSMDVRSINQVSSSRGAVDHAIKKQEKNQAKNNFTATNRPTTASASIKTDNEKIADFIHQGFSQEKIAKKLNLPLSEIRLLVSLEKEKMLQNLERKKKLLKKSLVV